MRNEGLTFEHAIRHAQMLRKGGFVGISIFHKSDYAAIEADEGCYTVHAYTKAQLTEMRLEAEREEEEQLDPFEITQWAKDEKGDTWGQQLFGADTLAGLVQQAQKHLEQNETKT